MKDNRSRIYIFRPEIHTIFVDMNYYLCCLLLVQQAYSKMLPNSQPSHLLYRYSRGAFHISKKMRQGESMVCYRINPNSRTIEFIHSSMDSRLISYKNEYLLPVCDIINSPASPSSIKMESPGEVKKQGDEFVIDQNNKIKIKLI